MTTYLSRDEIIRIAKKVGLPKWYEDDCLANESLVIAFANVVATVVANAEREKCAKLCIDLSEWHSETVTAAFESAADAIRARGQHDL